MTDTNDPTIKVETEPIQPVTVTVVGGTGDGGGAPLKTGTVGTTPGHQPNIVVQVITPLVAVAVRAGNTFCISLSGLMVSGGIVTKAIPAGDLATLLKVCAGLSVGITVVGIVKDCATVFSGLEKKFPLSSGSV